VQVLLFADDGHGVRDGPIKGVFASGYTAAQLQAAKEQNRMFHRGLVLAVDSLGCDTFVFSRHAGATDSAVDVARYGPVLNRIMREQLHNDHLPQQTLSGRVLPNQQLSIQGQSAEGTAVATLLQDSIFDTKAELCDFVKKCFAERPVGADAPGFIGAIVLKPELAIKVTEDGDVMQGVTSLRAVLAKRYVPAGVQLSGLTAPACAVTLQGRLLQLPKWDPNRISPVFSRTLRVSAGDSGGFHNYVLELRFTINNSSAAAPAAGAQCRGGAQSNVALLDDGAVQQGGRHIDYTPPRVSVVLAGSNIAVDVPLDGRGNNLSDKAWNTLLSKVQTSGWTRHANTGLLDGHERDGFNQLAHLCGQGGQNISCVKATGAELFEGPAREAPHAGGRVVPHVLLEKRAYIEYCKEARALLAGCGVHAVACLTLSGTTGGFDAGNLLSANKAELTNEALAAEVRTLFYRALVTWHRKLFALRYGEGKDMRWPRVLEEEAAKLRAEQDARRLQAEAAAAQAARMQADREAAAHAKEERAARARATLAAAEAVTAQRELQRKERELQLRCAEREKQGAQKLQEYHNSAAARRAASARQEQEKRHVADDEAEPELAVVPEQGSFRPNRSASRREAAAAAAGGAGGGGAMPRDGDDEGGDMDASGSHSKKRPRGADKPPPAAAKPPPPSHCPLCQRAMDRRTATAVALRQAQQCDERDHMLHDKDMAIEDLQDRVRRLQGRE
jgi:hypothetical protein